MLERRLDALENTAPNRFVFLNVPAAVDADPVARAAWLAEQEASAPPGVRLLVVNTGVPPRDVDQ
jgi:hypothetical protein